MTKFYADEKKNRDRSIIHTIIGSNVFMVGDKKFTKTDTTTDELFLDELSVKGLIGKNSVVLYLPEISMDGL